MTKADQIRYLFATTELTYQQIAEQVGCHVAYVRTVQQRMLGGGVSPADKKYADRARAQCRERNKRRYLNDPTYRARKVQYKKERFQTDPEYREKIRKYGREWARRNRKAQQSETV